MDSLEKHKESERKVGRTYCSSDEKRIAECKAAMVHADYMCGHTAQFASPGLCDPAGIYFERNEIREDGTIRISVLDSDCLACLSQVEGERGQYTK